MEFQITIDQRPVNFSNNFNWMIFYKNQFHEDPAEFLFNSLYKMNGVDMNDKRNEPIMMKEVGKIGFVRLSNMAWAMAKAADRQIPPPPAWTASFKEYPIAMIGMDIYSAAIQSMVGNADNIEESKNPEAPAEALTSANQ